MRTTGSIKDYKNGAKNNWRRRCWNEVLRRIDGREKSESILYLAGSQDLDREIAISKGVPAANLIAIDRSVKNASTIRKRRQPIICADVLDVLWSWPKTQPVAALMLDFCAGLDAQTQWIYAAIEREPFSASTVMVNLQRGRDNWSNDIRRQLRTVGVATVADRFGLEFQHRGFEFLAAHIATMLGLQFWDQQSHPLEYRRNQLLIEKMMNLHAPRFYSYQSGKALTFDSVVFNHPHPQAGFVFEEQLEPGVFVRCELLERDRAKFETIEGQKRDRSVALQIGAMLAVRTRRLTETKRPGLL